MKKLFVAILLASASVGAFAQNAITINPGSDYVGTKPPGGSYLRRR